MLTFVVGFAACLTFVSDSQAQSQTDDKYVKYANGVLDRYDSNRDGSLDEDEQKEMRDRPIRTIDQNGDGVISHAELVRHYTPPGKQARIARANARPQTRSRFKRKSSDEPISEEDEKAYQKYAAYANRVLTRYDSNKDGVLDEEERRRLRTQPRPKADRNLDGRISKTESIYYYLPDELKPKFESRTVAVLETKVKRAQANVWILKVNKETDVAG